MNAPVARYRGRIRGEEKRQSGRKKQTPNPLILFSDQTSAALCTHKRKESFHIGCCKHSTRISSTNESLMSKLYLCLDVCISLLHILLVKVPKRHKTTSLSIIVSLSKPTQQTWRSVAVCTFAPLCFFPHCMYAIYKCQ